jgi:MFS transporter, DHA1 family, tetracycline resistance protein
VSATPEAPFAVTPVRRAAVIFIFITVLIDILSFGVIIPVLPQLIKGFLGGDFAQAALWSTLMSAVFSLVQFVFSPVQGTLSDRYGRRPVVLLSNLGIGLDFVFMALVNSIPLLFVGRVISGICAASFTTANAYIADVTPPEGRAKAFGMLGAAFGIGFIIGPAVGGFLAGVSPRAPFWLAAGLALANFCYGYFVLPESLPPERRTARFDWKHANPVGSLLLLRSYPQVLGLATVVFLSNLAHYVLPSTFVLYADYRYHWGEQKVGLTLAAVGVCNVFVQAVLVGKLVPRLGERRTLLIGVTSGVLGFLGMGLATDGYVFLATIPLLALWGLAGPATQALLTRQVSPTEQGRLQGAVQSLASLGGIFGPLLFGGTFALFIGDRAPLHVPGAAFVLAAALLMVGLALAAYVTRGAPAVTPTVESPPATPPVETPIA